MIPHLKYKIITIVTIAVVLAAFAASLWFCMTRSHELRGKVSELSAELARHAEQRQTYVVILGGGDQSL